MFGNTHGSFWVGAAVFVALSSVSVGAVVTVPFTTSFGLLAETNGDGASSFGFHAVSATVAVAVGIETQANGTGAIAVGSGAQADGTGGIAIGEGASAGAGSGNIALGVQAGSALTSGANNIDIGHTGVAGDANVIRIGTLGTQTAIFIAGVHNQLLPGSRPLFIDRYGQLSTVGLGWSADATPSDPLDNELQKHAEQIQRQIEQIAQLTAQVAAAQTTAALKGAQIAVLQQQLVAQEREIQALKHYGEANLRALAERLNALEQQARRAGAEPLARRADVLGPLARALP